MFFLKQLFFVFFMATAILCAKTSKNKTYGYTPKYAAMVVDGETGKVLYEYNAHAKRFPASLTKKMTLYLLFEEIKKGTITLNTKFTTSDRATRQEPSILGLRVGDKISVDEIIRGLVTKSANDASVVAAEGLSGSVEAFAQRMNKKALELGMKNTNFRNPNGLPDPQQTTTAHDMILLGRALYGDFPKFYHTYFKLRHFHYKGIKHVNHNHMLGKVKGLDGIKTGYFRAAGSNISTSTARGNRRVFAVVIGGQNWRWRDSHCAELIETAFRKLGPSTNQASEDLDRAMIEQELQEDGLNELESLIQEEEAPKKTSKNPPLLQKHKTHGLFQRKRCASYVRTTKNNIVFKRRS
jgi:D-alanyl-D-alanine carboxypeptidase